MKPPGNGWPALVLPALVLLPLLGLASWLLAARWFEADSRANLSRRVAAAAAAAERRLDASLQRQVEATRALGTSPMAWLWVKFQGQRLTPSNRSHAQMALDEVTSYAGLLPGVTVYLASQRTRTVYEGGAAVAALSASDSRDAWYAASLATEGVVVSDDSRDFRTSMRLMNGPDLIGAVSCVAQPAAVAADALDGSGEEPGFSFLLADRGGSVIASRGPRTAEAGSAFDLFDRGERNRLKAAMEAVVRPAGTMVDTFHAHGHPIIAAISRTTAPGWYLFVTAVVPGFPARRGLLLSGLVAVVLVLLLGALLTVGMARARRARELEQAATAEREAAAALAREVAASVQRLYSASESLAERAGALAREAAAARAAGEETRSAQAGLEERSSQLRARTASRLSELASLASSVRRFVSDSEQAQKDAGSTSSGAAAAEQAANLVITTSGAVSTGLEKAAAAASRASDAAERTRLIALNAALAASRTGGHGPVGAQAAEEMRRISEEAAGAARGMSESLEEARSNLAAVRRAAQEAGGSAHEAAAASRESILRQEASLQGIRDLVLRLESTAQDGAARENAARVEDQARSAVEGLVRVMARIGALCGEISGLSETVQRESSQAAARVSRGGTGSGERS